MKRTHIFLLGIIAGFFLLNFFRAGTPVVNVIDERIIQDTVFVYDTAFVHAYRQSMPEQSQKSLTSEEKAVFEYVDRYSALAKNEYREFGILPSIKLGQAILESGAGTSQMARRANNHFAIKSRNWSELFPENHNQIAVGIYKASDDCPKFCNFTKFASVWASYRAHSVLLNNERYTSVRQAKSPQEAAKALQMAGYATDPNYSKKLMAVINKYELTKYDI